MIVHVIEFSSYVIESLSLHKYIIIHAHEVCDMYKCSKDGLEDHKGLQEQGIPPIVHIGATGYHHLSRSQCQSN